MDDLSGRVRIIIASLIHRTCLLRGSEQQLPPPAVFQILYCVKISKYSRFPNLSYGLKKYFDMTDFFYIFAEG